MPAWQDASYLIPAFVFLITIYFLRDDAAWVTVLAIWALLDIAVYHINMFWFDALYADEPHMWSYRRTLFQAALSYGLSILYFGFLYSMSVRLDGQELLPWRWSFQVATSLSFPDINFDQHGLGAFQIVFSLLLLVIMIGTIAGAMFRREQLAEEEPKAKPKK